MLYLELWISVTQGPLKIYVSQWPIFHGPFSLLFIIVIDLNYLYTLRNGACRGYSCPSRHLLSFKSAFFGFLQYSSLCPQLQRNLMCEINMKKKEDPYFFSFPLTFHCRIMPLFRRFLMPPTSTGHIGFGLCVRLFSHPCVHPFKNHHARVLKFHIRIPHGQIFDTRFFSCPSYLPFWSYAP